MRSRSISPLRSTESNQPKRPREENPDSAASRRPSPRRRRIHRDISPHALQSGYAASRSNSANFIDELTAKLSAQKKDQSWLSNPQNVNDYEALLDTDVKLIEDAQVLVAYVDVVGEAVAGMPSNASAKARERTPEALERAAFHFMHRPALFGNLEAMQLALLYNGFVKNLQSVHCRIACACIANEVSRMDPKRLQQMKDEHPTSLGYLVTGLQMLEKDPEYGHSCLEALRYLASIYLPPRPEVIEKVEDSPTCREVIEKVEELTTRLAMQKKKRELGQGSSELE